MSTRPPHVYAVIPGHNPSFAWLSSANSALVKRAVIFVHGFSGKAASTWMDFYRLIDNPTAASPWWETVDLDFFDYERQSIFSQISRNTLTLMNFLDFIWPKPDPPWHPSSRAPKTRRIRVRRHHPRRSLRRRTPHPQSHPRNRPPQSGHRELPPAPRSHRQTRTRSKRPSQGRPPTLRPSHRRRIHQRHPRLIAGLPFIKPITGISAAKLGLAPIAIPVTSARKATDDYTEYLSMSCFRAHILWADDENIVTSEPYQRDHACRNLPAKSDHPSVCKPNWRYLLPLSFVEKGVVNGQCK